MGRWIVGIDEAGRGPLAGPVTVAAVAATVNPKPLPSLKLRRAFALPKRATAPRRRAGKIQAPTFRDSKHLTAQQREAMYATITNQEDIHWAIASVSAAIIDRIGIVKAIDRAVARVLRNLFPRAVYPLIANRYPLVLLDGSLYAPSHFRQCTVIKGDECVELIAAASILAKVHRDRIMTRVHQRFPRYGFAIHKGYGTRSHYQALEELGPSLLHRRTFLAKTY